MFFNISPAIVFNRFDAYFLEHKKDLTFLLTNEIFYQTITAALLKVLGVIVLFVCLGGGGGGGGELTF